MERSCNGRDRSRRSFAISRHVLPESFNLVAPLQDRGRRECRVRAAPAVSCASSAKKSAHEHTGERRTLRHPLRNGFTAYFVLSPATNSFCHRRLRIKVLSARLGSHHLRNLGISNGCQDHTTSPYAATSAVPSTSHGPAEVWAEALKHRSPDAPENCSRGSSRPATSGARDAAASTASHPNVQ
jgi:hypothetical protein